MVDYSSIFKPLFDLFTQSQVHTILLAWIPTKLGPYLSGIIAVDMFITSVVATGISSLCLALYSSVAEKNWRRSGNNVTVQIEYYTAGKYGYLYKSVFYEALSWLISQQTKELEEGSFIVHPTDSNKKNDDEYAPPGFQILPEKDQEITIEHKGRKFYITYRMPGKEDDKNKENNNNSYFRNSKKAEPSIYLSTTKDFDINIDTLTEFLNQVVRSYLKDTKKVKTRSRYERNDDDWRFVQSLPSVRGLDTVALDKSHEELLKRELETFVNDKDFYERIGIPYRRGILLYGKPGTGKTSLINAISAQLSRDIYYLNLKDIKDDNELSAAFSDVPKNQLIVLEDVDTQSRVLHKRTEDYDYSLLDSISSIDSKEGKAIGPSIFSQFSLSTFLGCLDGHVLTEGNIIIMTTNHVEKLDPACIRPGRMDVHLDLGYCSHYQIKKMYKNIVENPKLEFPQDILKKIPENLLPPCEVMMTMVLYRNEISLIPQKIYELVAKYENMKPEDIARKMEEEAALEKIKYGNREKKEQVTDKNKEKKEQVTNEEKKEQVTNEDKEKKEQVTNEDKEKKEQVTNEDKEKKEQVTSEDKEKKEQVTNENKEKKEQVMDEDKKDSKEEKEEVKKEGIIKSEETDEKCVTTINSSYVEEDSDSSSTDVEVDDGNENIKISKETSIVISQVALSN